MIKFTYTNKKGRTKKRKVAPYEIRKGSLWATENGQIKQFTLDKIKKVSTSNDNFDPKWPIKIAIYKGDGMRTYLMKKFEESIQEEYGTYLEKKANALRAIGRSFAKWRAARNIQKAIASRYVLNNTTNLRKANQITRSIGKNAKKIDMWQRRAGIPIAQQQSSRNVNDLLDSMLYAVPKG